MAIYNKMSYEVKISDLGKLDRHLVSIHNYNGTPEGFVTLKDFGEIHRHVLVTS